MGKKSAPQKGMYEEMKDTPWITQGRELADIGGTGLKENANNVNVFDAQTRYDIDKLNRDVYSRAQEDLNKQYIDTMNKYAAANYNRFGSLNSTPSSYVTDQYQRQYQRDAANLAYERAANYENLVDQELKRRYDTLNEYLTLYNLGQTPHQLDLANWGIRNQNVDRAYENALAKANASIGKSSALGALGSMGMQMLPTVISAIGGMAGGGVGSTAGSSLIGGSNPLGSFNYTGDGGAISSSLGSMFNY